MKKSRYANARLVQNIGQAMVLYATCQQPIITLMDIVEGEPPSRDVVCSLFEGDYHLGVAALMNSLLKAGFAGTFRLGYRGKLPPWTYQFERIETGDSFRINDHAVAIFEKIDTELHFANYKPQFLRSILETDDTLERLYYFDPDIVIQASWNFYRSWADLGVAMCEEIVNGIMPRDHPWRLMWIEFMRSQGWDEPHRTISRYYNSGFLGISRRHKGFVKLWDSILSKIGSDRANLQNFTMGNRESPFCHADQDALNIAAMYTQEQLSTIGPEGMGFIGGGFTMFHANQGTKPWRKRFLWEALSGMPPLIADRLYVQDAAGPIRPFSRGELLRRRLALRIAIVIGRFYRK